MKRDRLLTRSAYAPRFFPRPFAAVVSVVHPFPSVGHSSFRPVGDVGKASCDAPAVVA